MRYDKERLDAAYAKVGLLADSAWQSRETDAYIRANQDLWRREHGIPSPENDEFPRSVLDTIPRSRLAEYGTYWYDEVRECAYEPVCNYSTVIAQPKTEKTVTTYVNQEFRNEDLFESQEVEKLFAMLTDTHSNTGEIENRCRNFLRGFEMKEIRPAIFTLIQKSDSLPKVPNVQPWLNCGYPLRHSDFNELASLSSEMSSLRLATHQTALQPVQQLPPPPPQTPPAIPKETCMACCIPREVPPTTRRLYSAVLQNQMTPTVTVTMPQCLSPVAVATVAATTMNTDELDELEREAIEQYRPSTESLAKTSEDSIISAKFQELERLALEQYNSASATETSAGAVGGSSDNAGNVSSPLHEPPCGGKPNPYAALLLANWNSVLIGLYRSRLLACLGAGARFR